MNKPTLGWSCRICGETTALEHHSMTAPNPAICNSCLLSLKEIVAGAKQSKTSKKDDKVADMVIGVIIKGNVVDYSNNASFGVKDGRVFVISMDGQVFVPEAPQPKPEPKKERIVITQYSNINIPEEKFPAIKEAIERVLNDEDGFDPVEYVKSCTKTIQKLVVEAEKKAFNAGREVYCATAMGQRPKYWTFEDYLNSKK